MRRQALLVREELALHGAFAWLTVRCAVLDRIHFGTDTGDLPAHLRPVLNRALDLVVNSELPSVQLEELERLLFDDRPAAAELALAPSGLHVGSRVGGLHTLV